MTRRACTEGRVWYPELSGHRITTTLVGCITRPRCWLLRFRLDDGTDHRRIVVKVRHSVAGLRRTDRYPGRPVLAPERTIPDGAAARLEFEGLKMIEEAVSCVDRDAFGTVRPLAFLDEYGAIVMSEVVAPTLREVTLREARGPLSRSANRLRPWHNSGRWLRLYHSVPLPGSARDRHVDRQGVAELFEDYSAFLGAHPLGRGLPDLSAAASGLGTTLPLVTSHGDFVSRNVFVGENGQVIGFDPMPLWRVPAYEDIARFLMVGLHLIDYQALSLGLLFRGDELMAREHAFLDGYFGADGPPINAVRTYQLLVLLDKWAETISKDSLRGTRVRHAAALRLLVRHYRVEAARLLAAIATGDEPAVRGRRSQTRDGHAG